MYYLSIGAMFKNESRYLQEWIEFHLMMGVDHFFLCCNDDDPKLAFQILNPYIKNKQVDVYHSPGGYPVSKQLSTYNSMITSHKDSTQWLAFIDLDEFLMPNNKDKALKDILPLFEHHVGLGVNWINYGSSGLYFHPLLQTESFIYRANDLAVNNRLYKSIVNPRQVLGSINPHAFEYVNDRTAVDEFYQPLIKGACSNYSHQYIGKLLRINHYRTRSWLDYREKHKKWMNGGHPDFVNCNKDNHSFDYYWRINNTNDILDTTTYQYLPELKKRLRITRQGEYPVLSLEYPDQTVALHDFF